MSGARSVKLTIDRLQPYDETNSEFPPNYVSTQKYSLLTFLPKNLWEQFHRIANLWFLLTCLWWKHLVCYFFAHGILCFPELFETRRNYTDPANIYLCGPDPVLSDLRLGHFQPIKNPRRG